MLLLGLILAALVYFVFFADRKISRNSPQNLDSEELLKKRFITGEIDEETYRRMLYTLRSN